MKVSPISNPPIFPPTQFLNNFLEAQIEETGPEEGDLSVEKLVELLLFTLQLIEGIRQTAVATDEPEIARLEAIVDMIDNFEMMGESEEGKFDLNSIFQRLMEQREKGNKQAAGQMMPIIEENNDDGDQTVPEHPH